jgi:MYXO-CTERM domain-containing protein
MWWSVAALAAPRNPEAFASLGARLDPVTSVTIDTSATPPTLSVDGGASLLGVVDGGVAVFTFDEVVFDVDATADGFRPLALLSRGAFTLSATLTVAAGGGAGGDCDVGWGRGGGGATGFAAGGGGFGGVGGGGSRGGPAYGDLATQLEAGSGGGGAIWFEYSTCTGGFGGAGGGGVELGSVGRFDLSGDVVAFGEPGFALDRSAGGGSGGGILVATRAGGTCTGSLVAPGGSAGYFYASGGGGGGGRILVSGLPATCATNVDGGYGATSGATGDVVWLDPDADADGSTIIAGGDCDDGDSTVYPSATEVVSDGVDQDCDGFEACWDDQDMDGARGSTVAASDLTCPGYLSTAAPPDCDDADPDVSPLDVEVLCNAVDDDCSPSTDDRTDADDDGQFCDVDCDDADERVFPGATETCDGVDEDCDGEFDEGLTRTQWFADVDGDGFGDPEDDALACVAPTGRVADGTDCDDTDDGVNPDAPEVACNGVDDDCDPRTPDEPTSCTSTSTSDTGPAPDAGGPPSFVLHGCGCGHGGSAGWVALGLAVPALLRRRRSA